MYSRVVANLGKSKRHAKYNVPYQHWEPLTKWASRLLWGPRDNVAANLPVAHARITWIELVIAFGIQTGTRIGLLEHDLHDKAAILHTTLNAYLRKCKVKE